MSHIEQVTPRALADLISMLPQDAKDEALQRLGSNSKSVEVFLMYKTLPVVEQNIFTQTVIVATARALLPELLRNMVDEAGGRLGPLSKEDTEKAMDYVEKLTTTIQERERRELKIKRDPKPRKTTRDDEIVRLKDEEGKSFGEIPRLLPLINPKWAHKSGKQLTTDAVKKAYKRHKRLGTN